MSIEDIFTDIYRNKSWGDGESASGMNCSVERTARLRAAMSQLFDNYQIKSVFDAPCGDFNWMKEFDYSTIHYIGADIVAEMTEKVSAEYANSQRRFGYIDITRDSFPTLDLWFCRAGLNHLSTDNVKATLRNFVASEIPYALITACEGDVIQVGSADEDWSDINWQLPPWNFPQPLDSIQDCFVPPSTRARHMHLFTRQQISEALA